MSGETRPEEDMRLAIIREICDREGHGDLVDLTTVKDYPARAELLCQRGCCTYILELKEAMTIEAIQALLERRGKTGTVKLRGTIEVRK